MANSIIHEPTVSGYKMRFMSYTVAFSGGEGTFIPIPLPNGGLFSTSVPPTLRGQNSCTVRVAWVKQNNVADSALATNYTGNFEVQMIFLVKQS